MFCANADSYIRLEPRKSERFLKKAITMQQNKIKNSRQIFDVVEMTTNYILPESMP